MEDGEVVWKEEVVREGGEGGGREGGKVGEDVSEGKVGREGKKWGLMSC